MDHTLNSCRVCTMSKVTQIALFGRKALMWNKGLAQLERPINMSLGFKALDSVEHLSCLSCKLTHHCCEIAKLKHRRELNSLYIAQIFQGNQIAFGSIPC